MRKSFQQLGMVRLMDKISFSSWDDQCFVLSILVYQDISSTSNHIGVSDLAIIGPPNVEPEVTIPTSATRLPPWREPLLCWRPFCVNAKRTFSV